MTEIAVALIVLGYISMGIAYSLNSYRYIQKKPGHTVTSADKTFVVLVGILWPVTCLVAIYAMLYVLWYRMVKK